MSSESVKQAQQIFDQSTQLIAQKKYSEALPLLLDLRSQGITAFGLESNLARVFSETGKSAEAIPHYLNAISMNRWDFDLRKDFEVALKKVPEGRALSLSHPADIGFTVRTFITTGESIVLGFVFMALLLVQNMIGKFQRRFVIPQVVLWLFVLFMGVFSMVGKSIAFVTQEAELRKTPLESAFVDAKIPLGTRVRIVDRAGKFLKIEQSGNTGWVHKSSLYIFKSGY